MNAIVAESTALHCGRCRHQLAPCTAFGLVVAGGTIRQTVAIMCERCEHITTWYKHREARAGRRRKQPDEPNKT